MPTHKGMLIAFICMTALPFAGVYAQTQPSQNIAPQLPNRGPSIGPSDKPPLGNLLDSYGAVAGGWYLEQRCNYFAKNLKSEFEWNVAQTNIAMSRQVSPDFLRQIQQSARGVADAKSCNNETEKLVMSAFLVSRNTVRALTGQSYNPVAAAEHEAKRISLLLLAQRLDDKCKVMPIETRKEFDGRVEAIALGFAQSNGNPALDRIRVVSADGFQKSGGSCDKADAFLRSAFSEARQMSPDWRKK